MKTISVILGIFFAFIVQCAAQTNSFPVITNYKTVLITNWIQPTEQYCFIRQQLYDKYRSPLFVTVNIPAAATIGVNYNGPVDFTVHLLDLSANWREGQTSVSVVVKNFPFIRGRWNYQNGRYYQPGGGGVNAQAMLISDAPRYNGYGVITYDSKTYDCGTPMTAPYKIVQTYTPPKPLTAEQKKLLEEKQAASASKTFEFLQKQAEGGSPTAQYDLAGCYLIGKGCEVDTNEAKRWFRLSASGGNAEASNKLAELNKSDESK